MQNPLIILSTWTALDGMKNTVLDGKLGAVMSSAAVLAALLTAYTLLKQTTDYINGNEGGLWEIVRPFVLLICTCMFGTFILKPLDSMVNVFTRDLAGSVQISSKDYLNEWAENSAKMTGYTMRTADEVYRKELEEIADRSGFGRFFGKLCLGVKRFLKDMLNVTTLTVGGIIGGVLFLVVKILLFVQQILCGVYLTLNALIGPFIFALAIIPSFASGIKTWVARYIQIAMWIPIGYLIMYINLCVGRFFCSMAAANGASLSMDWFMIALQIVTLVSIAAVPKAAGWVIESTGANDAHGAISQPIRNALRKLIKFH